MHDVRDLRADVDAHLVEQLHRAYRKAELDQRPVDVFHRRAVVEDESRLVDVRREDPRVESTLSHSEKRYAAQAAQHLEEYFVLLQRPRRDRYLCVRAAMRKHGLEQSRHRGHSFVVVVRQNDAMAMVGDIDVRPVFDVDVIDSRLHRLLDIERLTASIGQDDRLGCRAPDFAEIELPASEPIDAHLDRI